MLIFGLFLESTIYHLGMRFDWSWRPDQSGLSTGGFNFLTESTELLGTGIGLVAQGRQGSAVCDSVDLSLMVSR